jgi:hypothetical protein
MSSSQAPIVDRIRIIPRPTDFLDRNVGSSGEVFYSKESGSLRLYNGNDKGGFELAKADLSNVDVSVFAKTDLSNVDTTSLTSNLARVDLTNIDNTVFLDKALEAGVGASGGGGASVDVGITPPLAPEQGNIWLNSETGRLYVYIIDEDSTTTWVQPSVPIANSFVNIAFNDSTQFSAGKNDTLTLIDGDGIEISSNPIDKSLTISSTIETFSGNYNDLLNIPVEYSGINLKSTTESLVTLTNTTGTVDHDFSQSSIFYHDQLLTNFTVNFINIPETNERTISAVLVLDQSNTAYVPTGLEIDGQTQTILWQGASSPTGIANQLNIVSFTLIRQNEQWSVLGSFSTYG